ncbi:MAG: hypothetical protein BWY77_00096 [bacterium ADurb.Bin431]|nr:MAG: hypothetical protein BWY77_00096 [bacterium ADurb.Bin431]
MMEVKSYQDLIVWQKAMTLAEQCYRLTRAFPKEELFGMTSQIRRASISIPANIAEGWGRMGTQEYIQFLRIAQGSLKELETHLLLTDRIGLARRDQISLLLEICTEIGKMFNGLLGSLKRKKNI